MYEETDVIVIGAGPAGSTTASEISGSGFNVLLVEKDEYPGQTNVCAGGFPLSLANYLKLPNDVIEKKILASEHYFPWGLMYQQHEKYPHVTAYRKVLDNYLAREAERHGVKLVTKTLASEVHREGGHVYVTLENHTEKTKRIVRSKLVVFADGPNTLANRKFNIGFKPESDKTVVTVDCEIDWKDNHLSEYEFYYGPKVSPFGYGWIFPRKHTVNVGLGCIYSKLRDNIMKYMHYLLSEHPIASKKLRGKRVNWLGSALIPSAPAKKIYDDSMLVVGDAAGMVDPVTGGGIDFAVHGAKIAGKISIQALRDNDFSKEFLSQYQSEWQKTNYYRRIKLFYELLSIFLYLSKIDNYAYVKLMALDIRSLKGKLRDVPENLKILLYPKRFTL